MRNEIEIIGSEEEKTFTVSCTNWNLQPCIEFMIDGEIEAIGHLTGIAFADYKKTLDLAKKIMETTTSIYQAGVIKIKNRWHLVLREYPLEAKLKKFRDYKHEQYNKGEK